jgi:hypothetical protein
MSGLPMAAIGAAEDPRVTPEGLDQGSYPTRILNKLHDPSITIEEYIHHAKLSRAEENRLYGPGSDYVATAGPVSAFIKKNILRKRVEGRVVEQPRLSISAQGEAQITRNSAEDSDEKSAEKTGLDTSTSKRAFEPIPISDEEWIQASRAARTATW